MRIPMHVRLSSASIPFPCVVNAWCHTPDSVASPLRHFPTLPQPQSQPRLLYHPSPPPFKMLDPYMQTAIISCAPT